MQRVHLAFSDACVAVCAVNNVPHPSSVLSGELFGVAPVPPGQAHIAVEQAADSSRNFVLRLEVGWLAPLLHLGAARQPCCHPALLSVDQHWHSGWEHSLAMRQLWLGPFHS